MKSERYKCQRIVKNLRMLHLPSNRENNEILVTSQHTVFIRFGTRGAYFDTLGGVGLLVIIQNASDRLKVVDSVVTQTTSNFHGNIGRGKRSHDIHVPKTHLVQSPFFTIFYRFQKIIKNHPMYFFRVSEVTPYLPLTQESLFHTFLLVYKSFRYKNLYCLNGFNLEIVRSHPVDGP